MTNIPRSFSPQPILYKAPVINPVLMNRNLHQVPPMMFASKKLQNINCVQEERRQYGGLYIGDVICIVRPQFVRNHKISAIISCLGQTNYPVNLPPSILRKIVDASDSMDYPINIHFQDCYNFIQENRKLNRNVLVHCHAGISRSAAIVCAYLMKKNSWTLDQTISFLKQKRNRVKPNDNFMRQLKEYEAKCLSSFYYNKQINSNSNLRSSQNYDAFQQSRKSRKISMRSSLQDQPQRRFLNTIQNRSMIQRNSNQKNPIRPLYQLPTYNNNRKRSTLFDIYKEQEGQRISKNNNLTIKKRDEELIQKQKKKPTFGGLFKNKISQLIGRNTRIPWQNNQSTNEYEGGLIQFVSNQVNLSCM